MLQFTYIRRKVVLVRTTIHRIKLQNRIKLFNQPFSQLMLDRARHKQNGPDWNIHFTNFRHTLHPKTLGANRSQSIIYLFWDEHSFVKFKPGYNNKYSPFASGKSQAYESTTAEHLLSYFNCGSNYSAQFSVLHRVRTKRDLKILEAVINTSHQTLWRQKLLKHKLALFVGSLSRFVQL